MRESEGDKRACKVTVELLALAHERECGAALADAIDTALAADQLPNLEVLRTRFQPNAARSPSRGYP